MVEIPNIFDVVDEDSEKEPPIVEFKKEFEFLSNFYPSPIEVEGIWYPTVEHAYQAAKTNDKNIKLKISQFPFPGQAKKYGRRLSLIDNWDSQRLRVMENLLRSKFADIKLRNQLLATGDRELIEGNWWKDRYWGVYLKDNKGLNHLGKLLMKLRKEFFQERK